MILASSPRRASEEPHSSTALDLPVEALFLPLSVWMSFDTPHWRPPTPRSQYGRSVGLMVSKPVPGQLLNCRQRELSYGRSNRNVEYGHFSASACAFQRLANREQEDGTLTFRVRRKEVSHVIVEESQPSRTQSLCICRQVHPAADGARLQLDRPVPAIPISLQNAIQIGEKEDVHAGVGRQLLLQPKMVRFGAEFSCLQKFQSVPLTPEEVSAGFEPLDRMHDQVKIVELRAGRLKRVSWKASRGAVKNG